MSETSSTSVGVYVGTFDPFHVGHMEVVEWASRQFKHVLVCPFDNPKKTPTSPLSRRFEILTLILAKQDFCHEIIHHSNLESTLKELKAQGKRVVGIIGSDVASRQPRKVDYDECVIIPREGEEAKPDPQQWTIPWKLADASEFLSQYASSTMLREAMWTMDVQKMRQLSCSKQHADLLILEAKTWLSNLVLDYQSCGATLEVPHGKEHVKILTLPTKQPTNNEPLRLVIKMFDSPTLQMKEVAATKLFDFVSSPGVPKVVDCIESSVIYAYVGNSLLYMYQHQLLDPKQVGALAGKALAQLHSHGHNTALKEALYSNAKFVKMVRHFGSDHALVEAFVANPGVTCITHGDTNLGNFCLGDDGCVALIDLISASDMGIPSYDYFQFLSALSWNISNDSDAQIIGRSFEASYSQHATTEFTAEAVALVSQFWASYYRSLTNSVQ